jgi:hypothetical protein
MLEYATKTTIPSILTQKQRMQVAKDLEVQRMNMFLDTRIEHGKRSKSNGEGNSSSFCHFFLF